MKPIVFNGIFAATLVFQGFCYLLCVFGQFGFDRPGKYGLDFDHLVLVGIFFVMVTLSGIMFAVVHRKWIHAMIVAHPILIVLVIGAGMLAYSVPPRSPDAMESVPLRSELQFIPETARHPCFDFD